MIMVVGLGMAGPSLAAVQTYQLIWEMFDEPRLTTVCTYISKAGDYRVVEHDSRQFCPRMI